jgi:4-amino-4-deoxy-L-arabinose transferase-like glycosyltransferase
MTARRLLHAVGLVVATAVVACATVNLTSWPVTWFDEGIHLHVPKALVKFGAYADYSSEGLRHFGPTLAVGPTVMLPIAASFWVFGIGLLQGRIVMAAYLVASLAACYLLGKRLGGRVLGLVAVLLLLTSPGPSIVEYGRQVLGEVPGAFFLAAGLLLWFRAWATPSSVRLVVAGLVLGLATATKHVYLLALAPALLAAWILNLTYYRLQPQRVFLVTGAVCAGVFGLWQFAVLAWLSPGSLAENWALLRQTSEGAAFVFDASTSKKSLQLLLGLEGYIGLLMPALAYTAWRARRKVTQEQMWCVIWLVAAANLAWFVVASTGWIRYAFVGLFPSALLVARLWRDLIRVAARTRARADARAWTVTAWIWLAAVILLPAAGVAASVLARRPNHAGAVAAWLGEHAGVDAVVETWEPELAVFSDQRYHYPPPVLLIHAVAHIWRGGPSPAASYAFRDAGSPEYVLVGAFATWVGLYTDDDLRADYTPVHRQGPYTVWKRVPRSDTSK